MKLRTILARMSTSSIIAASIAAIAVAGGTAYAANQISGAMIANGSITGADIRQDSLTGADIKSSSLNTTDISPGSLYLSDLSAGTIEALRGQDGKDGTNGTNGTNGVNGKDGADGKDAPTPEYGVGSVWVARGAGAYSAWASYVSSPIPTVAGLPATTSGSFRFTCNHLDAAFSATVKRCKVQLRGVVLSDRSTADAKVYARMLIHRQSLSAGPSEYCEYADGADNAGAKSTVSREATTANPVTTADSLLMGVGGTTDCDFSLMTQPDPQSTGDPAGNESLTELWVPEGYYDVQTTFNFYAS